MNGQLTIFNEKPVLTGHKNHFDPEVQEKNRLVSEIIKLESSNKSRDSEDIERRAKVLAKNMTVDQLTDYADKFQECLPSPIIDSFQPEPDVDLFSIN